MDGNVTSVCEESALGNGGMEVSICGNLDGVAVKVFTHWQGPEMLNYHLWCSMRSSLQAL